VINETVLKIGDKVITGYHIGEEHIVRTVTQKIRDLRCKSGMHIAADGGGVCKECGKIKGKTVPLIDSEHYKIFKQKA
jgi:hypothetical protein